MRSIVLDQGTNSAVDDGSVSIQYYLLRQALQVCDCKLVLNQYVNKYEWIFHCAVVVMGVNLGICTTGGLKSASCKFFLIPYRLSSILDICRVTLIVTIFLWRVEGPGRL
jgi:hypothetical protein